MEDNAAEKLRMFGIHRIPLIVTLLLLFVFYMPVKSLELGCFHPSIGAACVFYWAMNRGQFFGYASAFIVGFIIDIYSTMPFGCSMLMMLMIVVMVNIMKAYVYPVSFAGRWVEFILVCLVISAIKYLLICIYYGEMFSLKEIVLNLLSTVMFYPLIAYINLFVQQKFLPPEKINE
ncbi:MAG: rod shape-determining protein MreD [Alphaproteobacteria bacterium]|nr:rod shape-determining protein MreD [Alphaproteobacteria bacterium]